MEDDDIRQALHATYIPTGAGPTFTPVGFKERATRPQRRPLVTTLVAAVAAVVVAVPIGVGLLLRAGVIGGSGGSSLSVLDLHMYGPDSGWAWSGGHNILHTNSGVQHWTVVPPPIGSELDRRGRLGQRRVSASTCDKPEASSMTSNTRIR